MVDQQQQTGSHLRRWPAPAKINLFLHVVGKRDDGYHLLQTAFQFLDYGDELRFKVNRSNELSRTYDYGFDEQSDICLRAARALKPYAAEEMGVQIDLVKRLPMGGGLGGGSSDAATTLIALNQLWALGLTRPQLAEIGLGLGADVPVFVMGQAAWAEGVGELLTPASFAEDWYLILNPNVHVSTADIFAHKHLTARPQMKKIRALEKGVTASFGENQLESLVRADYPQVDALLIWLSQYGQARMSGSGGSVFMRVCDRQQGLDILQKRPDETTGFVARGVNIHPLRDV